MHLCACDWVASWWWVNQSCDQSKVPDCSADLPRARGREPRGCHCQPSPTTHQPSMPMLPDRCRPPAAGRTCRSSAVWHHRRPCIRWHWSTRIRLTHATFQPTMHMSVPAAVPCRNHTRTVQSSRFLTSGRTLAHVSYATVTPGTRAHEDGQPSPREQERAGRIA